MGLVIGIIILIIAFVLSVIIGLRQEGVFGDDPHSREEEEIL